MISKNIHILTDFDLDEIKNESFNKGRIRETVDSNPFVKNFMEAVIDLMNCGGPSHVGYSKSYLVIREQAGQTNLYKYWEKVHTLCRQYKSKTEQ